MKSLRGQVPDCRSNRPMRILALTLIFIGLVLSAALAAENGRFTMSPTKDGFVRLDTQTGTVSLCNRVDGQWSCGAISKDQGDLESELARLRTENNSLRRRLAAQGRSGSGSGIAPGTGSGKLELPSDEDVDKVLSFFERTMRRLKKMMKEMKEKEPLGTPL